MKIKKVYLVGVHRYAFRAGTPALITEIVECDPLEEVLPRLCYKILFDDGKEDFVPLSDIEIGNYVIITMDSMVENGIPKITR